MNSPLNQTPNQNKYFPSIQNWEEEQNSQPPCLSTYEQVFSPLFKGASSIFNQNENEFGSNFDHQSVQRENSLIFNSSEEQPQLTHMNYLQFQNSSKNFYQLSDAEFHSQQLYRLAQNQSMPEYLYHPDIPYGTLTKQQLQNANFPEDNELSLEQFRNGYPPQYYKVISLSKEDYEKRKVSQEQNRLDQLEEQKKEIDEEIESLEINQNKDVSQELVNSTQPFSQLMEQCVISQPSSKKGRKGRNLKSSKKAKELEIPKHSKNKRNINLKQRTFSEFNQILEPETKSRQYTLTKTTKIYNIAEDLEALKNPSLTKEQRSKIRNRISAQKSRDRKKQQYGSLRFAIGQIQQENTSLKKELKKKQQAMKRLQRQMREQLCKKCKAIKFDFGDQLSTEDQEDTLSTVPSTQSKKKSKSKSVPRNSGFTLMRRSAGSALTGGLFAAFIGIICMIGIFMNSQSSGAGGAQRLLSTYQKNSNIGGLQRIAYQTPANELPSSNLIELQNKNSNSSLVELVEKNAPSFIQIGKQFIDKNQYDTNVVSSERSRDQVLNLLKASRVQFQNGLVKNILKKQTAENQPKKSPGFLKSNTEPLTSLQSNVNQAFNQSCLAEKIEQYKKEEETKLASYGNELALLIKEREAIDPSISSIYCQKTVMQPAQIHLNEQMTNTMSNTLFVREGCNYIHLMIPSSEISIVPSHSSPLFNDSSLDEPDYMLQIGCKVFEVNKIKVKQDSLNL